MDIATKDSWKIELISELNAELKLDIKLTNEEMEKLKRGLIPETMEDHWFMYYENKKLYCHRSWTGFCVFVVDVLDSGEIHHAIVTRDDSKYKNKDTEKDTYLLQYLIFSLIGRYEEAKDAFEKSIRIK